MEEENRLRIDDELSIPKSELEYRATRSGGPGGQHVNTSSTRIELTWNLLQSTALTDAQRELLREKLASRIDGQGVLRVVAARSRSQHQNRELATERLVELLARALRPPKPRKRTRVPRAAKEERLQEKKRRSERKRGRGRVGPDE